MNNRPPITDEAAELSEEEAEAILRQLAEEGFDTADSPFPTTSKPVPQAETPAPQENHPPSPAPLTADTLLALLEVVPDSLVVADRSGCIQFVNAQTERLFGYRREELFGEAIEILLPERFRARHVGQRAEFFKAREIRPMGRGAALVGRRKDGGEVPVEISLSPLETSNGPLVVASIRDVSERRKAEAHLRQLELRYRSLIEGIPAVTFMAAMDGEASELYVSPQIEKLLGFTQQEWLENPVLWYTQLHPDDQNRWQAEFARTVASAEPFQAEYRFVARDGRTVWVQGEARVVRDEGDRPLFLLGMAFDITDLKKAQQKLSELNATLEERVAERTAAVEAKAAELERSNKALTDFGSATSHDLREPLRTMTTYIQRLAQRYSGKFDEEATDFITRVVNAGARMKQLIEDLLKFARVRIEGKEPTPTRCHDALAAAQADLGAAIEDLGAEITCDELPVVLADPTQLAQLFQNLLANSLKFRLEGQPPRVHVRARRQAAEWVIAVADNGIGIDRPEALKKLFLLGTDSQQHKKSKYPGSGIGLSTCEQIVQRHGGRIWAESAGVNKGTTILFTMPAGSE